MNAFATIGYGSMVATMAWFAWSVVRVVIGPNRGKASRGAGLAVLGFLVAAIVAGSNGTPNASRPGSTAAVVPTTAVVKAEGTTDVVAAIPAQRPVPLPGPIVTERFQTSSTLVSLVVDGFQAGQEDRVLELAKAECAGATFCSVGVWTDEANTPRKLKMSDSEMASRLAHYVHSGRTGLERILWDCKLSPHETALCLP